MKYPRWTGAFYTDDTSWSEALAEYESLKPELEKRYDVQYLYSNCFVLMKSGKVEWYGGIV